MKTTRFYTITVLALILALTGAAAFVPQTASAESGGGTGTLTASGDGLAGIRGNGSVHITGNGILYIRDYAGDASIQVTGSGVKTELPNGWIRYMGFHGTADVSGSMISVALSGYDIDLQASGTGKFLLRGNGTYSVVRDGVVILSGTWTESAEVQQLP
ncbi:MAG: hypothetical protein AB1531_07450 [Chloroflexota bacterium]